MVKRTLIIQNIKRNLFRLFIEKSLEKRVFKASWAFILRGHFFPITKLLLISTTSFVSRRSKISGKFRSKIGKNTLFMTFPVAIMTNFSGCPRNKCHFKKSLSSEMTILFSATVIRITSLSSVRFYRANRVYEWRQIRFWLINFSSHKAIKRQLWISCWQNWMG